MHHHGTAGHQDVAVAVETIAAGGVHRQVTARNLKQAAIVCFAAIAKGGIDAIVGRGYVHIALVQRDKGGFDPFNRVVDVDHSAVDGNRGFGLDAVVGRTDGDGSVFDGSIAIAFHCFGFGIAGIVARPRYVNR